MADLREALFARLGGDSAITAIVGTSPKRIFPEVVPQGQAVPCIVIREMDDEPTSYLNGMSGHSMARVEVGCIAETLDGATDLRALVRARLDKYRGTSANLAIRDCVPTNQSIDEEQPISGSDVWRYVAVVRYEIGYNT